MATESFFSNASLAYLASAGAGKDGKTYSIKPTDGSGDFTFSRGSNLAATRIGPTGLIEKGRENLLLRSNQFDTTWVTSSASVTSGQTGYDGSSDAWLLTKSGANGRIQFNLSTGGVSVLSVYVKANISNYIVIQFQSTFAYFDLTTGLAQNETSGIISATSTDEGNGWYRCSIVFNISASSTCYIYPAENGSVSATSGSIYIQDAQLEIGLAATEVITTGATTGKAGLLENEPRFDYSGGATCPSLLLEPSRTQYLQYTEYLDPANTNWGVYPTGDPVTHTQNYAIAPDGTQTASLLGNFTSAGFNIINNSNFRTSTLVSQNPLDDTYTISVWLKTTSGAGTITLLNRGLSGGTNAAQYIQCNVTNEWQRFYVSNTYTAAEGASSLGFILIKNGPDTLEEVLVWGAQVEAGSYPTSYIPNHSGGSVTRGPDVLGNSNNISGLFNDNKGTLYFETDDTIFKGEINNYNFFGLTESSSGSYFRFRGADSTILAQSGGFGSTISFNPNGATFTKYLYKWDGTNIKVFIDGVERGSVSQTATFNPDLFRIGFDFGFVSNTKQLLIFPEALSDADCITLTT